MNLRVASGEKATDPGAGMYSEKGMDLRVEAFGRCDSVN